jgi:ABC-type glucose/galactose transport system permease subunit
MGENIIKMVLLPLYKDIIQNLTVVANTNPTEIVQNQVYRCMFAVGVGTCVLIQDRNLSECYGSDSNFNWNRI